MSDEFLDGNTSDLGGNTPFGDNTPGLGDDFGDDSDDVFGDDFSDLSQTGQNDDDDLEDSDFQDDDDAANMGGNQKKSKPVNWKKRYLDSSREAKRLYGELQGIKQAMPLISAVQANPQFAEYVQQFFNKGNQGQDTLDLPDDFQFDADEAFKNPQSPSGQVLNKIIESRANQIIEKRLEAEKAKTQAQRVEQDLVNKFKITPQQLAEIKQWASKRTITPDDIYFLYLKEKGLLQKNIHNSIIQDQRRQSSNVQRAPRSAATLESMNSDDIDRDTAAFNTILKSTGQSMRKLLDV